MFAPLLERTCLERIDVEQAFEEWGVAEVAEQRAVAGQQQLVGVLAAERAGVHLGLEVGDGSVEHRTHHGGKIDRQVPAPVNRGAADLSYGGTPVVLTAGYPGLSPMMGLTHGVHGIGDTVAISVHAAESAIGDVDAYVDRLDAALRA